MYRVSKHLGLIEFVANRDTGVSQAKHTTFYNFAERIRFAEHWKLVAESSEFHLTLSRAHLTYRAHFYNSKYAKNGTFKIKSGKAGWR